MTERTSSVAWAHEHEHTRDTARELGGLAASEHANGSIETEGSYQNGWGFFDNNSGVFDQEYTVFGDDDLFIDQVLGKRQAYKKEQLPLSPERQAEAELHMTRFMEAAWGLPYKTFKNLEHARNKIDKIERPENRFVRENMLKQGRYLQYQSPVQYRDQTKNSKTIHDILASPYSSPTMLYFGRPMNEDSILKDDKLDSIMRVYVHAKPEYAAAIAGKVIIEMRKRLPDYELYGKLTDIATVHGDHYMRHDNLLFYLQTHSQMTCVAVVLREMAAKHPELFAPELTSLDVACQTDIPGVSIGEEPIQRNDVIQESFNSSREAIPGRALELIEDGIVSKYPELRGLRGSEILKVAYKKNLVTREQITNAFRKAVRAISAQHGISTKNFSMNARSGY